MSLYAYGFISNWIANSQHRQDSHCRIPLQAAKIVEILKSLVSEWPLKHNGISLLQLINLILAEQAYTEFYSINFAPFTLAKPITLSITDLQQSHPKPN